MKKNIALSILLVLLGSTNLFAQASDSKNANSSQYGIFVNLENDYPQLIKNEFPYYEINRKKSGEKNYKKIATVKIPETYSEFLENIKHAIKYNPEPMLMKEIQTELIWKKFSTGAYDSIIAYRSSLYIQLALGVKYYDATAEKNTMYQYQITKKTKTETSYETNTVSYPLQPVKYDAEFYKIKETALAVSLQYKCFKNSPALIRIYREENYSGKFLPVRAKRIKSINNDTVSFAIYDTVVHPNTVYRYYVLPIDYYGSYGIVSDTLTAIASSSQYAGNIKRIDAVSYFNEGVAIRWKLSDAGNFNGIAIYRTENFDSTLVKIGMASAADTQFIDMQAEPMKMYFYALQPITRSGSIIPVSAKVTGMFTPKNQPLAPYISDAITSENFITLSIKNNDPQTRGFRIYRKLKTDSVFTLISGLIKIEEPITTFSDTTITFSGKEYFYMAKAESKGYVLSPASNIKSISTQNEGEFISIGIPQTKIIGNAVLVDWKNTMHTEDIVSYSLYRKEGDTKEILLQKNINSHNSIFADTTIRAGVSYSYGISYQNKLGKNSPIAFAKPIMKASNINGPANIYAAVEENTVTLSWEDNNSSAKFYRIYSIQNEKEILIAEIPSSTHSYLFSNVKQGEAYTFYLTSVSNDQQESLPGKMINAYIK